MTTKIHGHKQVLPGTVTAEELDPGFLSGLGTVAGLDTQIQYNDGGVFGGDADFTWNKTNSILTLVGSSYQKATIQGVANDTSTGLYIHGGDNSVFEGAGGDINLSAGDSLSNDFGGHINIFSGAGGLGSGTILIRTHDEEAIGTVLLQGGDNTSTTGAGGDVNLMAGNAKVTEGNGQGGLVTLTGGNGGPSGDGGDVTVYLGKKGISGTTNGRFRFGLNGGYVTQFDVSNISGSDKIYMMPNANGTLALTSDLIGNADAQYKVLISGATPFAPAYSGFLLDGTTGGKTIFAVTNTKTLTLTATDNYSLTVPATMTTAGRDVYNIFTNGGLFLTTYPDLSGTFVPLESLATLTPTANSAANLRGGLFTARSGATSYDLSGYLVGLGGYAIHNGTGTLAELYGLNFLAQNLSTGTITYQRGIYVVNQTVSGSTVVNSYGIQIDELHAGTVTNNYGLYISDIDGGSTDYSIYTNAGTVHFGGLLEAYASAFVRGASASGEVKTLTLQAGDTGSSGPQISFNDLYGSGAYPGWQLATIGTIYNGADGGYAGNMTLKVNSGGGETTLATVMTLHPTYLAIADAINVSFGTSTGTKFGTATNQKIAFWNTIPIVQPTIAAGNSIGAILTDNTGGTGTADVINAINPAIVDTSAAKLTDVQDALHQLTVKVNKIRTWAVALGLDAGA